MLRGATRQEKRAYKMVLPFLTIIVGLVVYLVGTNIILSFTTEGGKFTLLNYVEVITDPVLPTVIFNTFLWTVGSVGGQILVGFSIALLLNRIDFGEVVFRSILLILPWATLDVVAGVTWKWMYNDMYGVINDVLQNVGLIDQYLAWLGNTDLALPAVVIANIWKGYCLAGIFFVAGLQGIPKQLYEVAEIDGANPLRQFIHVTLPQMRDVILTTLLLTTIWTINYFPLIYMMTGGGPGHATETFATYIYRLSFSFLEFHESAALSNILLVLIVFIAFFFLKKLNEGERV